MTTDATQLERAYIPPDGEKVRLLTLDQLDGRTLVVRKIREFESEIEKDQGEDLSAVKRHLVRRHAVVSALLEDCEANWASGKPLPPEYWTAVKIQCRVSEIIGLDRRQKPAQGIAPLLGDYP